MKTLKKTYTAPKTELIKMEPVLLRFVSGVRVDNNKVGDVVDISQQPVNAWNWEVGERKPDGSGGRWGESD